MAGLVGTFGNKGTCSTEGLPTEFACREFRYLRTHPQAKLSETGQRMAANDPGNHLWAPGSRICLDRGRGEADAQAAAQGNVFSLRQMQRDGASHGAHDRGVAEQKDEILLPGVPPEVAGVAARPTCGARYGAGRSSASWMRQRDCVRGSIAGRADRRRGSAGLALRIRGPGKGWTCSRSCRSLRTRIVRIMYIMVNHECPTEAQPHH